MENNKYIKFINNTIFQVESYLGTTENYDTYLVNNKYNGTKFICKSRPILHNFDKYEKELYKYLSKLYNINKFINPLQYQYIDINNHTTHSFYPIINGMPISNIMIYLRKLSIEEHMILANIIIKNILEAIGNLHKIQIIHNNITRNNIIIQLKQAYQTNQIIPNFGVKLINFDFSCGKYWAVNSYYYKRCKTRKILNGRNVLNNNHNKVPDSIKNELKYYKKWDCFCTGLLCLQLLIGDSYPWDKIRNNGNNINENHMNKIYWQSIRETYLDSYEYNDTNKHNYQKIKKKYINLILNHLIEYPFVKNINPAKYTVDKIITMEKYI